MDLEDGLVRSWVPDDLWSPIDQGDLQDEIRAAVHRRLVSDVPVAFLLSGGLDSTTIISCVLESTSDVVAYTAVFDPDSSDLHNARRVAADYGIPLVEVPVASVDVDDIRRAVETIEIPMKAQVEITTLCSPLAERIASDGFKVVLSGEGSDEIYGGYGNLIRHSENDESWRSVRRSSVEKMARGNFVRLNKVFLRYGVEARTPFTDPLLVEPALASGLTDCPPGKKALIEAVDGMVPDYVRKRIKETFQGSAGVSDHIAGLVPSPIKFYNAEARRMFGGYIPRG